MFLNISFPLLVDITSYFITAIDYLQILMQISFELASTAALFFTQETANQVS